MTRALSRASLHLQDVLGRQSAIATRAQTRVSPRAARGENWARTLRALAWAGAALFCLSLPLFEAPKNIALAVAVAALMGGALRGAARLRCDAPALWLLCLFVAGLASSAASPYSGSILRPNLDLLRTLAAYWVFLNLVRHERQAHLVVELLLASAVLAVLWSLGSFKQMKYLSVASLGYCNNVGIYYSLIAALAFSLCLAATAASWGRRLWWGAALGLGLATTTFALCRSALLALVIFCGLALLVAQRGRRLLWLGAAVLAVIAATALLADMAPTQQTHLAAMGLGAETLRERWELWRLAGGFFLEHPLLGIGSDSFETAARAALGERADRFFYLGNAHSLYLNTLAERGLIGLILLLAFFGAAIHRLRRAASTLATPQATALWLAGLGAVLIVLIIGLLDHPLHHEHALLMATLLALPLAQEPRGRRPLN